MRFHMEWHRAVWEGPAAENDAAFCRFMQRAIEIGYGRMKRMVIGIASPEQLILRAPALWDTQHTHGKLTAEATSRGATLRLRGNPVTTQAISRRAMAEAYRTIASLSRATNVKETHGLELDDTHTHTHAHALVVRITWER